MFPTLRRVLCLLVLCAGSIHASAQTAAVVAGPARPTSCVVGTSYIDTTALSLSVCTTANTWTVIAFGGTTVPAGMISFVNTGTCPSGWTEVSGLNGKMLRGTVAANMDVGGTGGSDSVTPTFTGSALGTHTHTTTATGTNGTSTVTPLGTNATGTVTPLGTNGTGTVTPLGSISIGSFVNVATATTGNCAATNLAIGTGATTACKATAPNLTVPAEGHSGTLTWAGSSSVTSAETFTGSSSVTSAQTFTGSSSTVAAQTFTGNSVVSSAVSGGTPAGTISAVDTRAAYLNLIACQKS
jgi:hypothetical protein